MSDNRIYPNLVYAQRGWKIAEVQVFAGAPEAGRSAKAIRPLWKERGYQVRTFERDIRAGGAKATVHVLVVRRREEYHTQPTKEAP